MSAVPKSVDPQPPAPQREMTEEDFQALMASDVWLHEQDLTPYHKKWVAVLGERIIDSDANKEQLHRRLGALGGTIDQYKVLTRYVPGFDELYE
jgi:hypothetical protein